MQNVSLFADRLASMQREASEAMQNYTPGGTRVPDNIYLAREQGELGESAAGNLMASRTFTVADGEFTGLKIWDHIVIERVDPGTGERVLNPIGLVQLRRWLEMHGFDFPEDNLAEVEEQIRLINEAAPLCRIRSKTSSDRSGSGDEYTRVTVLEIVSDDAIETTTEVAEVAEEAEALQQEATEEATEGYDIETLLAFCASQGIKDVNDEMEIDAIISEILSYQFKGDELTDDERTMLYKIGLPEEQIITAPFTKNCFTIPPPKQAPKSKPKTMPKPPTSAPTTKSPIGKASNVGTKAGISKPGAVKGLPPSLPLGRGSKSPSAATTAIPAGLKKGAGLSRFGAAKK